MTVLDHRDGLPWWEAPVPPRRHDCQPQTTGTLPDGMVVERCACGSIRADRFGPWHERNTRVAARVAAGPADRAQRHAALLRRNARMRTGIVVLHVLLALGTVPVAIWLGLRWPWAVGLAFTPVFATCTLDWLWTRRWVRLSDEIDTERDAELADRDEMIRRARADRAAVQTAVDELIRRKPYGVPLYEWPERTEQGPAVVVPMPEDPPDPPLRGMVR